MNRVPGKPLLHPLIGLLILLACMLAAPFADAYQPGWPPPPAAGFPQQPALWQPQQPPAPGYRPMPGGWAPYAAPGRPPYAGAQPAQPFAGALKPYLETELENEEVYVHQNLVLTIDVVSSGNLSGLYAELPVTDEVIIRQLGTTNTRTRSREGRQEIINRMHYQLTPLRSGELELPPIRVIGKYAGNGRSGQSFEITAAQGIRLQAKPPQQGVRPWLPLHNLELNARLDNDESISEGTPLTLIIEQRAVGLTGAQLPSPESQLQSPRHRLYLEKTANDGRVSEDDRLIGTRTDTYTLVPQQGDRVHIPAIKVDWWNVDRERKETAIVPARLLNAQDGATTGERRAGGGNRSWQFWLPPLLVASFLAGVYWRGVKRVLWRVLPAAWFWLERTTRPSRRRAMARLLKLSPRRHMHVARRWFADMLPRSWRMWFCVRSADNENDPDDWNQVLRFLVNRRLGISAQQSHFRLTEQIIDIHPNADPEKLRALMKQLEQAVFGTTGIEDFDRWKAEFKHQIRPRLVPLQRRARKSPPAHSLPALNPEA